MPRFLPISTKVILVARFILVSFLALFLLSVPIGAAQGALADTLSPMQANMMLCIWLAASLLIGLADTLRYRRNRLKKESPPLSEPEK